MRAVTRADTRRGARQEVLVYSCEHLNTRIARGWTLRAYRGVCEVHVTEGCYRGLEGYLRPNNN